MNPKISSKTALILFFMSYIRIFTTGKTMNFLPKPPTDNLYKLSAISGTWLLSFGVIYYIALGFLSYNLEVESRKTSVLFSSQKKIVQIDERLEAISNGNLKESIVPGSIRFDGSEKEVEFLEGQKEKLLKIVDRYLPIAQKGEFRELSNQVFKTGFHATFIWFISILGALSIVYGYRSWYVKIQRISDEQQKIDLLIKKLTARKLINEIKEPKED